MSESAQSPGEKLRREPPADRTRRYWVYSILSVIVGVIVSIAPLIPGLGVLLNPWLRRRNAGGKFIRITTLEALRGSQLPLRFQVVDERRDAWNKYPPEPIDGIFLVPQGEDADGKVKKPVAFSATCPHLGCAVDFKKAQVEFECPCHTSAFAMDGAPIYGPSPRGLDTLNVEIRNDYEVWIEYKKFQVGKSDKVEV